MTYVCITGNEDSPERLERRLERVLQANPRLLCELRLDFLDLNPASAFAFLAKLPRDWSQRLILTQRLKASGETARGNCGWDVLTWQSWWKDVMALKPWFAVDLDWLVLDRLAGESLAWQGTFRSRHAFFSLHASIEEIERLLPELESSARNHNAGIKIAAPVTGARDLARLSRLTANLAEHPLKIVVAMGAAGRAWRWARLAGDITYFAVDTRTATAAGQDTLANVLPYVTGSPIPSLYVLWSADAKNTFGEKSWNRAFLARGNNSRYVNIPCSDLPAEVDAKEKREWATAALEFMERANVKGASVTQPFKEYFPLALQSSADFSPKELAINTLKQGAPWETQNTDGLAVIRILQDLKPRDWRSHKVLILGGGGAAQAVRSKLEKEGVAVEILRRRGDGSIPSPQMGSFTVLISTWPGSEQEKLVAALKSLLPIFELCLDAQFSVPEEVSPLAEWCKSKGIEYFHGIRWWKEQAFAQDIFWFGKERFSEAKKKLLSFVPTSKSETNRALAIAAIRSGKSEIREPSYCKDTEVMLKALERLGMEHEEMPGQWTILPPTKLHSDGSVLFFHECATALRIISAMAPIIAGERLRLDAAPSLRVRPINDLFRAIEQNLPEAWPLEISLPAHFPTEVSAEKTSQFSSGFLIAAAAMARSTKKQQRFFVTGTIRSLPYFLLTKSMLEAAGFIVSFEAHSGEVKVSAEVACSSPWKVRISPDASALSALEVIGRKLLLPSFFSEKNSGQGDHVFSELLLQIEKHEQIQLSLKDTPDLAPSLWAAALLFRKSLQITEAPHLHDKECDRALALVEASRKLGLPAENSDDGFFVDARHFVPPEMPAELVTKGDHRLAMAFGALEYFYPKISMDNRECVSKSFPHYWESLEFLRGLLP